MPVAKSYKNHIICGEPYEKNGKMYIVIAHPNTGNRREARWYTDAEYNKLYPEDKIEVVPGAGTFCGGKKVRSLKDTLGFEKGYITIFKGNTNALSEWFHTEPSCRYSRWWGWYVPSEFAVPDLPAGITPVQIPWDQVAYVDEDALKTESVIDEVVAELLFEENASQFQGTVGERLDLELLVIKVIDLPNSFYGSSKMHIFVDADENQYVWTTGAKTLTEGENYSIRGTVKEHSRYKGINQTVLTRCMIK